MTGFNHILTGVAIAVTVRQPVLAPVLAVLSHFVLDMVPHFWASSLEPRGEHFKRRNFIIYLTIDGVLCVAVLALGLILFPQLWWLILICTAAATLPDWLWAAHYLKNIDHRFFDFHHNIQHSETVQGAYVEAVFGILMLALVILLSIK